MKTFSNRWSQWSKKIKSCQYEIPQLVYICKNNLRFPVFLNLEIVNIQFISNSIFFSDRLDIPESFFTSKDIGI